MTKTIANIGAQMGIVVHDRYHWQEWACQPEGAETFLSHRNNDQTRHPGSRYFHTCLNGGLHESG
jgi:hypothetical protein